ncbi:hypothetical protein FEM03_19410 [Phragmitibacter flavus]|uniref:Uncharacterized protein n=1 Tax=Phragmitibacter flavus TaxID=2576071 RepID=A0A5R8K9Q6_9BACT|nr:hypothetical protein [Phragmitibacter flavus]TLD69038.1 hypothetical protein FEM03_19410 [Phragmitibacter flavus]
MNAPQESPTSPEPDHIQTPVAKSGSTTKTGFPWFLVTVFGSGLIVVAIVAAIIAWPDISRLYHRYKALGLLEKADAALEVEEWQTASDFYSKAYLEASSEPEVIRGIALFMRKTNSDPERSLQFWQQLIDLGAATTQDRIDTAQTYLQLNKSSEARQLLATIPPAERTTKPALEIEAGILNIEGRTAEAATVMRQALRMDPDDPQSRLKLSVLDLRNPLSEVQNAAIDNLWELARGDTDANLAAIDLLARETRLTPQNFAELLDILKNNPKADSRHRYSLLGRMLERHPDDRAAVFAREEAELEGKSPADRIPYLLMLQSINEHPRVLEQLPMDRVLKLREFFSLYVESLAATEQWTVLRNAIRTATSLPISPPDLSLLNARISKGLGESAEVVSRHLLDAAKFATAARDIRSVRRISAIADSMGHPTAALEALRTGANLPQHRVALLEAVLGIQTSQNDSEGMLKTLNDLVETDPTLHYHKEKQLYLKLLLGVEIETIPLKLSDPKIADSIAPAIRQLLNAMSAYRQQNIDDLRTALADLTPDYFQPGQRAVLSGLLNAGGDPRRAFEIAEKVPDSLLLEGERKFLTRAL